MVYFVGGNGIPIPFLRFFSHKITRLVAVLEKSSTFAENKIVMEQAILGSEKKFAVEVIAEGFSMEDNDFSLSIMKGHNVVKEIAKSDLVVEDGTWLLCVDTSELGAGTFDLAVTAEVPDSHFQDMKRTEIERVQLLNVRKL